MAVNRKCCDPKFDSSKPPRSGSRRVAENKRPALDTSDRLNGWTTTKLKRLRRGLPVSGTFAPLAA